MSVILSRSTAVGLLALLLLWPPEVQSMQNATPFYASQPQAGDVGSASQGETASTETGRLLNELAAHEARIRELEEKLAALTAAPPQPVSGSTHLTSSQSDVTVAATPEVVQSPVEHEHSMRLPGGGPELKIRGFADFNLGFGSVANPLIFPLVPEGTPIHNSFQTGEFDLFLSSRLSKKISFIGELVIGSDATNSWGLDIERLQLTYKASPYFAISGGRYHTSIGYYNTAYHHGTWFQTAMGRPFMYFFEDSGGVLPVHSVGVTTTGLVPGTGGLELHWTAEVSNGRSSDPAAAAVQNFLSDKNHKAFNLAAYVKPRWLPGLQAGGSYYRDRLIPAELPHVDQNIESAYAVFINPAWEFLNEAVIISNRIDGSATATHTPLMYSQIAKKFGKYRPYFRYQYVNGAANDPVNIFTGRYQGPSLGLRADFTDYVALKVQYNRVYQRNAPPSNGLDLQAAYAF